MTLTLPHSNNYSKVSEMYNRIFAGNEESSQNFDKERTIRYLCEGRIGGPEMLVGQKSLGIKPLF